MPQTCSQELWRTSPANYYSILDVAGVCVSRWTFIYPLALGRGMAVGGAEPGLFNLAILGCAAVNAAKGSVQLFTGGVLPTLVLLLLYVERGAS
jgi:hypothetical protein